MTERIFCVPGSHPSLLWAADELKRMGQTVTDTPSESATHLLLGVPCKQSENEIADLLTQLPPHVTVFGGNLKKDVFSNHRCKDLLQDEPYLWKNAAITAQIAVTLAAKQLTVTWEDTNVLILGWGRIGQCLAKYLTSLGANVTVAARKEAHRGQIAAFGYTPLNIHELSYQLSRFRVIFNTVPAPVLSAAQIRLCRKDCVKLELASTDGMAGSDILTARGLPGTYAPETSGKLIAATVLRLCAKEELP